MGMYMGSHPASATGRTRHAERVFVKSSSAGRTHAGVRPSLHCMRTGTDARALENHEDALADAQHGLQEARRVSEVPRQSAREMHHEQGYAYGPDPAELHLLDGIVVRNQLHARGVSFGPASEIRLGEHGRRPGVAPTRVRAGLLSLPRRTDHAGVRDLLPPWDALLLQKTPRQNERAWVIKNWAQVSIQKPQD